MGIVSQSPQNSHSSFPPYLMLCAPKIAGLLCAPKVVQPPPRQSSLERIAAYLEIASARLQARYDEIDIRIDAMREAYGLPPREITLRPPL